MSRSQSASTFAKGLAVLNCFESGRTDLTMADIARLTGFDRATARRLCLTLTDTGYLTKHGKSLELTPKVVSIAGGYFAAHNIGRVVQPVLNQFAEELEGEIALAVRDGTRAVYIARSAVSKARLSFGFSVGSTLPLLPTAVGRMLLAGCTSDLQAKLIAACPLDKFTAQTDMDITSIQQKIQDSATQGFAYTVNEFELGAGGIAVPVPDMSKTQAVLATSASANQLAHHGAIDRMLDILRRAAMNLRP
jgi:IclR family pca regulon transcriptional regulator